MTDYKEKYRQMLQDMERLMEITNKRSVLILLQHTLEEDREPCIPAVRESVTNIIGFVSLGDESHLPFIIGQAEGIVDTVMVDIDAKRSNSEQIRSTASQLAMAAGMAVAYCSDYATWVSSAIAFMLEIEQHKTGMAGFGDRRLLVGRSILATKLLLEMVGRGMDVCVYGKEYPQPLFPTAGGNVEITSRYLHTVADLKGERFDTLIGCSLQQKTSYEEELSAMHFDWIFDIGTNSFSSDFVSLQRRGGARVYRSDDRAGVSGMVVNVMETSELVKSRLGRTIIGGIPVVSGGYVGEKGDVVVDNYNDAHSVLGIAQGDGTFKHELTAEDEHNINKIKTLI